MGTSGSKQPVKYSFVDDLTVLNILEDLKFFPNAIDLLIGEYYKSLPGEQIVGKIDLENKFDLRTFASDDKYLYILGCRTKYESQICVFDKITFTLQEHEIKDMGYTGYKPTMCVDDKYLYFLDRKAIYKVDKSTFKIVKTMMNGMNSEWLDLDIDQKNIYIVCQKNSISACYAIGVLDKINLTFPEKTIVDSLVKKARISIDEHSIYVLDDEYLKIGIYDKKSYELLKNIKIPYTDKLIEILKQDLIVKGDFIYVLDNGKSQIKIFSKFTGNLFHEFNLMDDRHSSLGYDIKKKLRKTRFAIDNDFIYVNHFALDSIVIYNK